MGRIVAVPISGNALRFVFFLATGGRSSNGRTPDSGSGYLGSNPSLPAKLPLAPDDNGYGYGIESERVRVRNRDQSKAKRVKLSRSARTSSPRSSRSA